MFLMLLRMIMSLSATSFYRRVTVKNKRHIEANVPTILALNHPNAFMDPVAFSLVTYPPKHYYLARGDVFNNKMARFFLERLGLAPIYRIQDGGKEGLQKNAETYVRVNELLGKNKKIMVFAEGLCIQERRLRPIKKGVPRMVFGAMDQIQNKDFVVVPVGVNYSNASKVGSTVFFNIGEPIRVADHYNDYKEHPSRAYNKFVKILEQELKQLITHIDNPERDKLVVNLEQLLMRSMCKQQKLNYNNPEEAYGVTKQITAIVNEAEHGHKTELDRLNELCSDYIKKLNVLGARDWVIDPANKWQLNLAHLLLRGVVIISALPIVVSGMLGNYLPYKLSDYMVKKKVRNIEFHSSFNLGIGTFLTLFFYILQFFIAYALVPHYAWAILVVVVSLLTGKFVMNFYPFITKTVGLFKAISNPTAVNNLRAQRKEITDLFAVINKN